MAVQSVDIAESAAPGAAPPPRRRPGAYFVQLLARYVIAVAMLAYAATKLVGMQLVGEPSVYDTPMSVLSGFELMWAFFGYSPTFVLGIAAAELAAAALLLFARTARPGYLLTLALIGPIAVMDVVYGVGQGTVAAFAILAAALVLAAYDARALRIFLFGTRFVPPGSVPGYARRLAWLKLLVVPVAVVGVFATFVTASRATAFTTELSGAWQFRATEGPVRLYVDRGALCSVKLPTRVDIGPRPADCTIDEQADTLTIRTMGDASIGESFAFTGTYQVSDDGQRLSLSPDGGGASLELDRVPERLDEQRTFELYQQSEGLADPA